MVTMMTMMMMVVVVVVMVVVVMVVVVSMMIITNRSRRRLFCLLMTSEMVGRTNPSLKFRSLHGRSREDKGERRPDLVFVEPAFGLLRSHACPQTPVHQHGYCSVTWSRERRGTHCQFTTWILQRDVEQGEAGHSLPVHHMDTAA